MLKINNRDFFNKESIELLHEANNDLKSFLFQQSATASNISDKRQHHDYLENLRLFLDVERLPTIKTRALSGKLKKQVLDSCYATGLCKVIEDKLHIFYKVEPNFPIKRFNPATSVPQLTSNFAYFGSNIRLVLYGQVDASIVLTACNEEELKRLLTGEFYIHICRKSSYRSVYYKISNQEILLNWQQQIEQCINHSPLLYHETAAKFIMARNREFASDDELLMIAWTEYLQGGLMELYNPYWVNLRHSYEQHELDVSSLKHLVTQATQGIQFQSDQNLKDVVLPLITEGKQKRFISNILNILEEKNYPELLKIFILLEKLGSICKSDFLKHVYKSMNAIISIHSSENGQKFLYLNSIGQENTIDVKTTYTGTETPLFFLEEFWKSFGSIPPIDIQFWHSSNSVPICEYQTADTELELNKNEELNTTFFPHTSCLSNLSLQSENDFATNVIEELMDEALANKEWTIPQNAFCEVSIGKFNGITLCEERDRVYFKLHYNKFLYLNGYMEPITRSWWINPNVFNEARGIEPEKVVNAILLVVVSLVRDFWVVEERESNFQETITKLSTKSNNSVSRVIYLPRVRYINQVNPRKLRSEIDLQARAKHTVRAHLRRSQYSSEVQNTLAKHYNFQVPKGFTFVRPHERGSSESKKIYRSKSAAAILGQEFRTLDSKPVAWFEFEKDVARYMAAKGFQVVHRTAHRGIDGDGGIDVLANKVTKQGIKTWLIQCKAEQKPTGPSTVRDLMGANIIYGGENVLMIISLSGFTSGAKKLAQNHSVYLVDGATFAQEALE